MIFGTCFTTSDPHPSLAQLLALRAIGITHMRLSISLPSLCPVPDLALWQWLPLDQLVADIRASGIIPYFNPGGCPPWASEGEPAYIGLIPGCAWWNVPGPDEFASGIHFFDQDATRNPKYAAVDQAQDARPYLEPGKVPHVSSDFMFMVGQQLAKRYGSGLYGAWNEPGDALSYPPIRYDRENFGGMGDVIRERFMLEIVKPFSAGVASVLGERWTHVGNEADGDGVLDRCLEIDGEDEPSLAGPLLHPPRRYDIISYHSYGAFNPIDMHYATMEAFKAVTKARGNGRPEWISEINASTPDLREFTKERIAKRDVDAIFFLRPGMFFEGDGYAIPDKPIVSANGRAFAAAITEINGPVDPIRTTLPVGRKRAVRK